MPVARRLRATPRRVRPADRPVHLDSSTRCRIWSREPATTPPRSSPGSPRNGWIRGCSIPARGGGAGQLLDRHPAPQRDRRAAHGARAQGHDHGHPDPPSPDARPAHEMDPRHRPRRDRHPDPGRAGARAGGHQPRGAGARAVRAARLGVARRARRHDHRAAQAAGRLLRLRGGALHARRGLRPGGPEGVRRAVREGLHLPRPLHGQLGSGTGRRSPTWRSRPARSPTRSTTSTTRWPRAPARSPWPRSAPRRCSPTPRSPSIPTTSATGG